MGTMDALKKWDGVAVTGQESASFQKLMPQTCPRKELVIECLSPHEKIYILGCNRSCRDSLDSLFGWHSYTELDLQGYLILSRRLKSLVKGSSPWR